MEKVTEIFSNREISIFSWVLLILLWLLLIKDYRKLIISVIHAFFKLTKWYILLILYIAIWVIIFYQIKIWDCTLLKDTIFWTFGVAFVLFLNINKALENEKYFYNIFKDCFKLIILLEFIVNLFSFNIIIELISIPFILITSLVSAHCEYKKVYSGLNKLSNILISIYCIAVLVFSTTKIINNIDSFLTVDNLKSVLLGPIMTILFIPFLYFTALYMAYEVFLKSKKNILKENICLYRFLKWAVIKRCKFNLKKIRIVMKKLHIYTSIDKTQIINDLNLILTKR